MKYTVKYCIYPKRGFDEFLTVKYRIKDGKSWLYGKVNDTELDFYASIKYGYYYGEGSLYGWRRRMGYFDRLTVLKKIIDERYNGSVDEYMRDVMRYLIRMLEIDKDGKDEENALESVFVTSKWNKLVIETDRKE